MAAPPADPSDPPDAAADPQADTGRRNRRTRLYSDGYAAVTVQGAAAPQADAPSPPRPRQRPKSDTVVELPQDRAAVALPELPDEWVVTDPSPPKVRIAVHRPFGQDDDEATRTETRTATVTASGSPPASQRPTAREVAGLQPPRAWQGPAGLIAAMLAGALAAYFAFGRDARHAPLPPPKPAAAHGTAIQAPAPLHPPAVA
ncbi:MAG: hypothetical protein FJ100_17300, partial [Deltaproteobacteria bacterium]|nr:hypothetical protein [Deltaproteobacteria bacterium]